MPQSLKLIRSFLLLSCATVAVVVLTLFVSYHLRTERLTQDIMLQHARALFEEMILTRQWVSEHGGAYVKVKPGVAPNPFLATIPDLKVNITDQDGQLYTLRNPGLVFSGVSQLAEKNGSFKLHVASLNPVNPASNSPDAFETEALIAFEQGEKEAHVVEQDTAGPVYRYMAPLYYQVQCNNCHGSLNYAEGDIRGGISVTIPMDFINARLADSRRFSLLSTLLVMGVLFAILFFQSRRFMSRMSEVQTRLMELATSDSLTGLLNRRTVYELLEDEIAKYRRFASPPLACLLLDIDDFKVINDSYGHQAGDAVLAAIATAMKNHSRRYDIISRYGGEEFLVILPGTDLTAATTVGEKLRQHLAELAIPFEKHRLQVTVSIGAAQLAAGETTTDSLIGRADAALYQAKRHGKNQVRANPA